MKPVDKLEFGCFGNGEYCSQVASWRTALRCCCAAWESHICVTQTALGALNQGLNVHVAADAVSSRTELNWKVGLNRMQAAGAVLSSTEMMMYELLGKSGTPAFKEILKYLNKPPAPRTRSPLAMSLIAYSQAGLPEKSRNPRLPEDVGY